MPVPGPSQVLVKMLCLSVDPYLRIKLYPPPPSAEKADNDEANDSSTDEFAPFKLNEPLSSMFVGEVVSTGSDVQGYSPGDRVSGVAPWSAFAALNANTLQKVPSDLPPSAYLNVLGLIGLSTYFPLVEIGQPKAGETVFISGAAGAVGSLVGQLCKAFGCKVIGSTGSDNKVEVLKELGFDHAFNYKTKSVEEALEEWAEEGVDVYWDNVGGETLDTLLTKMKRNGRIVACGSISQYHVLGTEKAYGVKNYFKVVAGCLTWQGFLATDYVARAGELFARLGKLMKDGKVRAHKEKRKVVCSFNRYTFSSFVHSAAWILCGILNE
jgi:NADPH-dependent curcumin reductase CurA